MKRVFGMTVLMCLFGSAAYADVTVKMITTGPSMGPAPGPGRGAQTSEVPATWYIKNGRARVDMVIAGSERSTILDPAARQMITLNPETREAIVYDLSKLGQMQQSVQMGDVKVLMTPTGQTTKLLGQMCTEYILSATMPMSMGGGRGSTMGQMTVTMEGTELIAKDAPGTKDFVTFFRAAAESGLLSFGGRGNPGMNEGGLAAIYKAIADAGGIPYEQHLSVKIEGAPAGMVPGGSQPPPSVTKVTSVSTDPIPDDRFEIPAGYTKKTQ
jgi:hypothetical protein